MAFIGYQNYGASNDQFAFIILKDLVAGTQINVTDRNYTGTAFAITGESIETWTADKNYSAGTVIQVGDDYTSSSYYNTVYVITGTSAVTHIGETGFFVSASGELIALTAKDQLFAYQGEITSPNILSGLNCGVTWNGGTTGSNCMLPSSLTDGDTALAFSSPATMGIYDCNLSGLASADVTTLRQAINNSANWTRSRYTSDLSTAWCGLVVGDVVTITPTPMP